MRVRNSLKGNCGTAPGIAMLIFISHDMRMVTSAYNEVQATRSRAGKNERRSIRRLLLSLVHHFARVLSIPTNRAGHARPLQGTGPTAPYLPKPTRTTPASTRPSPRTFERVKRSWKNRRAHSRVQMYPTATMGNSTESRSEEHTSELQPPMYLGC